MFFNADKIETHIYVITFFGNGLPSKIKLGYELFNVATFYHNTMKCFNCFRYGNLKKLCEIALSVETVHQSPAK